MDFLCQLFVGASLYAKLGKSDEPTFFLRFASGFFGGSMGFREDHQTSSKKQTSSPNQALLYPSFLFGYFNTILVGGLNPSEKYERPLG